MAILYQRDSIAVYNANARRRLTSRFAGRVSKTSIDQCFCNPLGAKVVGRGLW